MFRICNLNFIRETIGYCPSPAPEYKIHGCKDHTDSSCQSVPSEASTAPVWQVAGGRKHLLDERNLYVSCSCPSFPSEEIKAQKFNLTKGRPGSYLMSDFETITILGVFDLGKKRKAWQRVSFFFYQNPTLLNIHHFSV